MRIPLFLGLLASTFAVDAKPLKSPKYYSSPPVELQASRILNEEVDKKIPSFTLSLKNGSPNTEYQLIVKNMEGVEEVLHPSLKLGAEGQLMEGAEPFHLGILSMGLGEPLTLKISSKEGTAETRLIPRPMQIKENGYFLSLQLTDPERKTFQFQAVGFAPGEEISFFTCSGSKQVRQKMCANKNGEIHSTLVHQGPDAQGGEAYVEIQGKNGVASIVYPWGSDYKKELNDLRKLERVLLKS